ncbi:thioredoxin family protein [Methanofollis tationis]|uniref:Thioredoxin family protein n=2 Tax=Methanofollis tationis TaxID=81417 RepID=A0A7K4HKT0_9EURY|nr:thioredoxin family protein [Methanofollis tationis]
MNMTGNGGVVEVSDTTWERAIERGTLPAVVMFYSETCPFCKQIEPYFRQFAGDFGEKLLFARLNVSENPWTIERYAVRQTPTFKFFCTGKPVQEIIGAAFPALLKRNIEEFLKHGEGCARSSTEIDDEITGYG